MPTAVSQMRDALAQRMAAAYGPGTRDYSSVSQQAPNPAVANFLQALASRAAPQQTWVRPMRDATTDTHLADPNTKITTGYRAHSGPYWAEASGVTRDGFDGSPEHPPTWRTTTNAPSGAFDFAIWNDWDSSKTKSLKEVLHQISQMVHNYYKTNQL